MRIRGWGWVLPALIVVGGGAGCSSSDYSSDQGGGYYGGQTGSLSPCSAPAFEPAPDPFPSTPSVPTGDAAVVFHTGCSADAAFKITDPNGEPVPFELEALEDGVVLVKTDEALTPGTYQVETPDGERTTVIVTAATPLPSVLGSLALADRCDGVFSLDFDPAVEPYLPLMRLEYAIDGGPRQVWFEYGTVTTLDGAAWLEPPNLSHGDHRLEVFALIAGEEMGPESTTLDFYFNGCDSAEGDEGTFQCSFGRGWGTANEAALALFGVALAWARRRRPPLTRRR